LGEVEGVADLVERRAARHLRGGEEPTERRLRDAGRARELRDASPGIDLLPKLLFEGHHLSYHRRQIVEADVRLLLNALRRFLLLVEKLLEIADDLLT